MLKQKYGLALVALAAATLLVGGFAVTACAQSTDGSTQSVAEAARKAREQKKNAAKPVKTVTNDDLPKAPVADSGLAAAKASDPAAAKPEDPSTTPAAPAANDEKTKQKKADDQAALELAKKDLAQAATELDVLQRKAALDSDVYYSKPGYQSDTAGKANLDAEAQQISDKKQAVDALKAHVAELQALVGEEPTPDPGKNSPQN